jgi:hypothetical protein
MMKKLNNNNNNRNKTLRLNFQFDIDNDRLNKSTCLYFPPINIKYNSRQNEVTLIPRNSEDFLNSSIRDNENIITSKVSSSYVNSII